MMNKLLHPDGNYVVYLRKSRADLEAEQHGEGETLARHRKILTDYAKNQGIPISAYYEEVVSGDSIACRPVMQKLIDEVDANMWDGVLVMEVERLARGDTKDQGIVAESFKYSSTLIITPTKIYDPNNEFDEEYFEFGLFMSRREYKTIRRRLISGKVAAVKEGKWPYNKPPYGYQIVKLKGEKGYMLEPTEEAKNVRMIFELYTQGMGYGSIAKELNKICMRKDGKPWGASSIPPIITNPVYTGKIRQGYRKLEKRIVDGNIIYSRPCNKDFALYDGLHPAIISEELFQKAQERKASFSACPIPRDLPMTNPLSGLVVCSKCGRLMQRRPCDGNKNPVVLLFCKTPGCNTVSSRLSLVEDAILDFIREYIKDYEISIELPEDTKRLSSMQEQLCNLEKEKDKFKKQLQKQYDLLEQGIYDTETFLQRSNNIKSRITECNRKMDNVTINIHAETARLEQMNVFLPKMKKVVDLYASSSVQEKNKLLKEVISRIEYTKDSKNAYGKGGESTFTIRVFPRIRGFDDI